VAATMVGLPGEQVICDTAVQCASRLADALFAQLRSRMASFPRVHLALSGGSSGPVLAAALAQKRDVTSAEWARLHLWMVDERCVAPEDPRLNFGALREALLGRAPVPKANLHPMPVLAPDGDRLYEAELRAALAERPEPERRLDAIVLGMGRDGHTASLFPRSPALEERERWIVIADRDTAAAPGPRMTMTLPLINRACYIALFVTGESKREALRRLAERNEGHRTLPVAGVSGTATTRPVWFLDREALPS
jgi:6-phosphogluconolactonase